MTVLAVLVAGALGAVARFLLDGAIKFRWSPTFPWATAVINVSGSLLLGFVAGLVTFHAVDPDLQAIVGTGFCGGYTTFSTASFESVRLTQQRRGAHLAGATLGVLFVGIASCALGLVVAWAL